MSDLISREDAIEAVGKLLVDGQTAKVDGKFVPLHFALMNTLSALPSAEATCATCADRALCIMSAPDGNWKACKDYRPSAEAEEYEDYEHATLVDIKEPLNASAKVAPKIDHDRDWIIGCIQHDGFIHTDRFDKANQIILDALSADAVQGWIPCSERLPNEDDAVLATIRYLDEAEDYQTDPYYTVEVIFLHDGKWMGNGSWVESFGYTKVLAWMPLPKPYREESEVEK